MTMFIYCYITSLFSECNIYNKIQTVKYYVLKVIYLIVVYSVIVVFLLYWLIFYKYMITYFLFGISMGSFNSECFMINRHIFMDIHGYTKYQIYPWIYQIKNKLSHIYRKSTKLQYRLFIKHSLLKLSSFCNMIILNLFTLQTKLQFFFDPLDWNNHPLDLNTILISLGFKI